MRRVPYFLLSRKIGFFLTNVPPLKYEAVSRAGIIIINQYLEILVLIYNTIARTFGPRITYGRLERTNFKLFEV